jgi:hypothetical protein
MPDRGSVIELNGRSCSSPPRATGSKSNSRTDNPRTDAGAWPHYCSGPEPVLSRKKPSRPSVLPIFDGEKDAKLIVLACSEPPQGCALWTLRSLEKKVVDLDIVERASDSTIGRVLKKTKKPT